MDSQHFVGKVALRGLVEHDGKILVCKCPGDNPWMFPGGRLHKEEQPEEGLIREFAEELGVELKVEDVFYTEQYMHVKSRTPQVFLFFRCSFLGEPTIADANEIEQFQWVTHQQLQTLSMWEDCRRAADKFLELSST